MDLGIATLGASFLAGILTALNPCVLPILPIVGASAMTRHWSGLVALALGLAVSFTVAGVAIASIGLAVGLDGDRVRYFAAGMMLLVAIFLISDRLQAWFSARTAGISGRGHTVLQKLDPQWPGGQFLVGLLLGAVWTPCIGPTLGAAIALASQGQHLAAVSTVMVIFSIGAVIPLFAIGLVSRQQLAKRRAGLMNAGQKGKKIMGYGLLAVGVLVITSFDKTMERWFLGISPDWLIELTTRF